MEILTCVSSSLELLYCLPFSEAKSSSCLWLPAWACSSHRVPPALLSRASCPLLSPRVAGTCTTSRNVVAPERRSPTVGTSWTSSGPQAPSWRRCSRISNCSQLVFNARRGDPQAPLSCCNELFAVEVVSQVCLMPDTAAGCPGPHRQAGVPPASGL